MTKYIIRRLLWVIVLLFLVSLLTFVIFYLLPSSDPALLRAGRQPNPALVAQIRHNLGLDKPWYTQYFDYMKRLVLHFDFGYSYQSNVSVKSLIFSRLPATISLAAGAAVVWLVIGIAVGTISAVRRRSFFDRSAMGAALVAISAPVYWLGLLSLFLFANDIGKFKIFPGAGSYVPISQNPGKWFTSLLLPWFVLAASFAAIYARLLRANLIEAMSEDYIRTARAKGLDASHVVLKHALRNALIPIVTLLGLTIPSLLSGAAITETVFSWPGLGYLGVSSVIERDYPVVLATVMIGGVMVIIGNLLADIAYAFVDPRIKY